MKLQTESKVNDCGHIITILVATVPVRFIIDSGADINAITERVFAKVMRGESQEVIKVNHSSDRKIRAFGSKESLTVSTSFYAKVYFDELRPSGFEKFFVIKEASNSLLSRSTALRYSVLNIGWSVTVKNGENSRTEFGLQYLYNVNSEPKKDYEFPKFKLSPVSLNIDLSVRPRRNTYTNIPFAWREAARERLVRMEKDGIIEKVTSEMNQSHCSAMLAVPKAQNDFRLVVDLRSTNQCIVREPHKMPTMDSILAELHGSEWFSTIDLSNAFYHVEIRESDRYVTNFFTGKDFFRFKRLPFGLCNAPDIFQNALETVVAGIPGVLVYLDDILIYGPDETTHDERFACVMKKLNEHNVEINHKKCTFKKKSVRFLGFTLTSDGYKITQDRLEAIRNFRTPSSVAEVQSFIGMLIFVDKFVFGRADKTKFLQTIIREKKFTWGQDEQREFDGLQKEVLSKIKKLGYFKQGDRTDLIVDASAVGLGAVLVQYDSSNEPRIIGCASKVLTQREAKYPQVQREALAIVWAIERFQMMLRGQHFTVVTDNEGNEFIFGKVHRFGKRCVTRAEAWALRLQQFKFDIRHIPGNENIADVFSRLLNLTQEAEDFNSDGSNNVLLVEDDPEYGVSTEDIAKETETDAECQLVYGAIITNNWSAVPSELRKQKELWHRDGGVLLFNSKMFIPVRLRKALLKVAHKSHFGVGSIKRTLRQFVFWPGISKQIEEMVATCEVCQRTTETERPVPFKSRDLPEGPWRVIQIDFLQIPLGSKELLMVCDTYSRMTWAIEMKKTDTAHTIKALNGIFSIWGFPEVIQSDNGPPFNSNDFSNHWTKRGIRHNKVVARAPWMNGMVERRNKGVIKALTAATQERKDWRQALQTHLDYYNNVRPHSTTLATPFELMTGRLFRGIFPVAPSWSNKSKFTHEKVQTIDRKAKEKSITNANEKNRAKESDIKANDWVWVKDWNRLNKLSPLYHEKKFKVIDRTGPKAIIRSDDGQTFTRWISALKKTTSDGSQIAVSDTVWAEKDSKSPPKLSNHRYKVLAEKDELVTVRNDSGITITCDKSDVERQTDYSWLDNTARGEAVEESETSKEEKQNLNFKGRPEREKKKPNWQKDYKLFNILG